MLKNSVINANKCVDNLTKQGVYDARLYFSKPVPNLGVAIALLTGSLVTAIPAQASINVPTDMSASPLCIGGQCASEFTAKMLMFEEFGLEKFSSSESSSTSTLPNPSVDDCQGMPNGAELDEFLDEDLHPKPSEEANEALPNAWDAQIKECVGLAADINTVIEGRPPNSWFGHQRWNEFWTDFQGDKFYFQTAMTGARLNGGLRDKKQLHEYKKGEFAPGGLYHNTVFSLDDPNLNPAFNGTTKNIAIKIHPNLPTQSPYSVWTFDGTLPPKLLMARYGDPILFRHYNALPIDVSANNGFGMHTISTHEHNGHNPAESDGFAHSYFYPGQFYDYHWPMVLAGHDSINTDAQDKRAGAPDDNGGINRVRGDWRETMSTHWFHDHMLDFTAQNVYKGNAAMMNYYSALDRGREPVDESEAKTGMSSTSGETNPGYACHYKNPSNPENVNLCLPSGNSLDWGNRDYDVNLVVADKAWDKDGQLKFNIFNTDGFLGDRITVNWVYKPYLDVRARKYRFRILNGSVSRYYKIALVKEIEDLTTRKKTYVPMESYMVANDGNIMQHAVKFPNPQSAQNAWPVQAIAERYDMVVDFKGHDVDAPNTKSRIFLVNLQEHENGKRPAAVVPLASVMSGLYKADGKDGDPGVGKFLEFRVKPYSGTDLSMNPADYVEGKLQMIPLNRPSTQELKTAVQRTFEFGKSDVVGDTQPWLIKTDGGVGLKADPHRISAAPEIGKVEIWHIQGGNGWSHPVHVHFEEGQLLYRGGKTPPPWEKYARKDVYRVGPEIDSTTTVDIAVRFREFGGTYVEHCHNTQHEDKAMLLRWDAQKPGQLTSIPTPELGWEGATYSSSYNLPTWKIGDLSAKKKFVIPNQ